VGTSSIGSTGRLRRSIGALLGLVASLGCAAFSCATTAVDAGPPSLDGTRWVLTSPAAGGPPAERPITLGFEGGQVQGSDGCNRYAGGYTRDGDRLEVGPDLASTRMACPPEVMQQADAFVAALTSARRFRIEGDALTLSTADGAVALRLTRAEGP